MAETKITTVNCTMMDRTHQRSVASMDVSFSFLDTIFNKTKSDNLKALLESNSYAKVIKRTQSFTYNYDMPETSFFTAITDLVNSKIGLDTCDQKAVLIFRYATSGKSLRFSIPAPNRDLFYYVDEKGLRVKADKGGAIATSLSSILGTTIQFVRGYHTGKP